MLPREKGRRSHSITTSELTRGIVPKLVRQHILLKEKGGMRESVPRQVDRESRGLQGERGL